MNSPILTNSPILMSYMNYPNMMMSSARVGATYSNNMNYLNTMSLISQVVNRGDSADPRDRAGFRAHVGFRASPEMSRRNICDARIGIRTFSSLDCLIFSFDFPLQE